MREQGHSAELLRVEVHAGAKSIIREIDLRLGVGEVLVLVGPNGAGKSTILRTLIGRARPSSGDAFLDGRPVHCFSGRERAARIAWLPQYPEVREPVRVLDLIVAARFRFRESRKASEAAARAVMERQGIAELAERAWPGLSGGERQRIALATLAAQEAPLLLLDEPANHLDPTHQIETYLWIGDLARRGHGVLCVTHDVDLVGWLAQRVKRVEVVGVREGRIHFRHDWESPLLLDALSALFDIPFVRIDVEGRRHVLVSPGTEGRGSIELDVDRDRGRQSAEGGATRGSTGGSDRDVDGMSGSAAPTEEP